MGRPPASAQEPGGFRARITVVTSLVLVSVHIVVGISEWASAGDPFFTTLMTASILIDLIAPVLLWLRRPVDVACTALMLGLCVDIVLGGLMDGGLRSTAVSLGVGAPLMAALLVGPRLAFICSAILSINAIALVPLNDSVMPGAVDPTASDGLGRSRTVLAAASVVASCGLAAYIGWAIERQRRRALGKVEASEKRFRLLAEHTADAMFVCDDQGRLVDVNDSACSTLGYSRSELLGMTMADVESDGRSRADQWRAMSTRTVLSVESVHRRRDGVTYPVDVRISRIEHAGSTMFLASARDVTGRRYAEEALLAAKEEAERANRTKSQFIANMSHEMRTPLNSVIGFARVLQSGTFGALSDTQRKFATNISDAGEHLLSLVNDLLDVQRMEEGHSSVELSRIDITGAIDDAATLVRAELDDRSHTLEVSVPPGTPHVMSERQSVIRILTNLLSNAAKYTDDGGHIRVRVREDVDMLTVFVQDDGVGIAPADHARVFNYFEQVDNPLSGRSPGSGIGLALTRQLVQKLGGQIGVESAEGLGSTFWFTLPAVTSRPPELAVRAEAKVKGDSPHTGGPS